MFCFKSVIYVVVVFNGYWFWYSNYYSCYFGLLFMYLDLCVLDFDLLCVLFVGVRDCWIWRLCLLNYCIGLDVLFILNLLSVEPYWLVGVFMLCLSIDCVKGCFMIVKFCLIGCWHDLLMVFRCCVLFSLLRWLICYLFVICWFCGGGFCSFWFCWCFYFGVLIFVVCWF